MGRVMDAVMTPYFIGDIKSAGKGALKVNMKLSPRSKRQ